MKKLFFITFITYLFLVVFAPPVRANEEIDYVVSYKWGIIQKDAGDAKITLENKGDGYNLTLYGKTRPWADKIYQLRDTLISTTNSKFNPHKYVRIAHERGKFASDEITFTYKGNEVSAKSKMKREKKDGTIEISEKNLTGAGKVYDMLSVFFYLRNLDYASMKEGDTVNVEMFSGKEVEELKIRFKGREEVKLNDKSKRDSYHILFNFTSKGKKKSSEDIECWLSTDNRHVPLLIIGSLPVGQIRCRLVSDKH